MLTLRENMESLPEGWQHQGLALRKNSKEGMEKPEDEERITVGQCPPGERLNLRTAAGSRSIKRLCIDHRISLPERDSLPAIYVGGKRGYGVWVGIKFFCRNKCHAALLKFTAVPVKPDSI